MPSRPPDPEKASHWPHNPERIDALRIVRKGGRNMSRLNAPQCECPLCRHSEPEKREGALERLVRCRLFRRSGRVKLATFNLNGVNGRLPVLLRWLVEREPDIVCLQELKAPDERFPAKAIEAAGYEAIWHGQKAWNGVAILSRVGTPVETRRGLPGDPHDMQSRYIEAAVNGVLVAGLYLPNGNPRPGPKFDYKLAWFERLLNHAAELQATGLPVVLAGDFNVMPTDLDVYRPERWLEDALFAPQVRDAYAALLAQGWTDALRTLHPDERLYTFWDYLRNAHSRNAGLRIDHLLVSPKLAPRLVRAEVDAHVRGWEKASDHAPVWIDIADRAVRQARPKARPSR